MALGAEARLWLLGTGEKEVPSLLAMLVAHLRPVCSGSHESPKARGGRVLVLLVSVPEALNQGFRGSSVRAEGGGGVTAEMGPVRLGNGRE